jgi:hypothetical protein
MHKDNLLAPNSPQIESSYRWVIVSILSFSLWVCALQSICFAPITSSVSSVLSTQIYSISVIYVEFCSFIYFITFVLFLIPAYAFEARFGVRNVVLFGNFFGLIGSLLRIGAFSSFWFAPCGSFLSSLAQPFLISQITKVSVVWFTEEKVFPI